MEFVNCSNSGCYPSHFGQSLRLTEEGGKARVACTGLQKVAPSVGLPPRSPQIASADYCPQFDHNVKSLLYLGFTLYGQEVFRADG